MVVEIVECGEWWPSLCFGDLDTRTQIVFRITGKRVAINTDNHVHKFGQMALCTNFLSCFFVFFGTFVHQNGYICT